jgi:nitrous oxidase accessory protein NosD
MTGQRLTRNRLFGSFRLLVGCTAAIAILAAGASHAATAARRTIYVSLAGTSDGTGSKTRPLSTIAAALALAQPGDTVRVAPGDYHERFTTVRSGRRGARITLSGAPGARIVGDGSGRQIQIFNDYITLRGFTVSGADKLVWIQGAHEVRIEHDRFTDGGGECVRIKYLSTHVLVAHNRIGPCGLTGFNVPEDRKNGEGVYIGTDPGQLDRNPTAVADASDANVVQANTIDTDAAECVDIKEAAERNRVIGNNCSGSRDPKGSGFDARGNNNLFLNNRSTGNVGAGIRFGGYGAEDGTKNSAIGNVLVDNGGWAFLVLRQPQARVCGNVMRRNALGPSNVSGMRPGARCPRRR